MFNKQLSRVMNVYANLLRTMRNPFNVERYTSSDASYGRGACAKDNAPKCDVNVKDPCSKKTNGDKKEEEEAKKKSMWENPECCLNPCPDILPRFDDLYYKPSDKAKRKYWQTWAECPKLKIAPRKICCFDKVHVIPMQKRVKPPVSLARCAPPTERCPETKVLKELMSCDAAKEGRCPKIVLPFCKGARNPPKCKRTALPEKCTKVCTPYPSYSECDAPKKPPKRPVECGCLDTPNMCEVYALQRRLGKMK